MPWLRGGHWSTETHRRPVAAELANEASRGKVAKTQRQQGRANEQARRTQASTQRRQKGGTVARRLAGPGSEHKGPGASERVAQSREGSRSGMELERMRVKRSRRASVGESALLSLPSVLHATRYV